MKIDRTKFLALTAAIGGAVIACSINSTTNNTPSTPDDASTSDATDDGSSGGDASGDVAKEGSTGDAAADGADGAACDDTVGSAALCADYMDGGTGPADGGDAGNGCLTTTLCTNVAANFKPRIQQKILECLVAAPTCESTTNVLGNCVDQALNESCPDTSAQASCDQVATVCGDAGVDAGISTADCAKALAGATATGRTAFVACMIESACFQPDALTCFGTML
jgi:hypothetical protein